MAECPVVPFFGAFLRELREILAAPPTMHDHNVKELPPPSKSPKFETRRERDQEQQRQVVGETQTSFLFLFIHQIE